MASTPKFTGASAAFGTLPVLKEERELGFLDHSWINIGLAIATWAFLLGGSTALVVGARDGIYAIIIGNLIGVSIMAVSDDEGKTWYASQPLLGFGAIQPTVLRRDNGDLVAYMRDLRK